MGDMWRPQLSISDSVRLEPGRDKSAIEVATDIPAIHRSTIVGDRPAMRDHPDGRPNSYGRLPTDSPKSLLQCHTMGRTYAPCNGHCLRCEFDTHSVKDFQRNIVFLPSQYWDLVVSMLRP